MRDSAKLEGISLKIEGESYKIISFHYNLENDKLYVKLKNRQNNINFALEKILPYIKEQGI